MEQISATEMRELFSALKTQIGASYEKLGALLDAKLQPIREDLHSIHEDINSMREDCRTMHEDLRSINTTASSGISDARTSSVSRRAPRRAHRPYDDRHSVVPMSGGLHYL